MRTIRGARTECASPSLTQAFLRSSPGNDAPLRQAVAKGVESQGANTGRAAGWYCRAPSSHVAGARSRAVFVWQATSAWSAKACMWDGHSSCRDIQSGRVSVFHVPWVFVGRRPHRRLLRMFSRQVTLFGGQPCRDYFSFYRVLSVPSRSSLEGVRHRGCLSHAPP